MRLFSCLTLLFFFCTSAFALEDRNFCEAIDRSIVSGLGETEINTLEKENISDIETKRDFWSFKNDKEFETYVYTNFINVIAGEYQEEACDLVVEGIEPISFRRFYNHLGHKNPIFGHWRIMPEWYMFYNFNFKERELTKFKKYAVISEEQGSSFYCDQAHSNGYCLNHKEKGFVGDSGQNHPLNISINFSRRFRKDKKNSSEFCCYDGNIKEGNGGYRTFTTDWVPYNNDVGDPDTPPYQARIIEYKRPNGNVLEYSYLEIHEIFGRKKPTFHQHYLLTGITAHNRDKTKVLGWLKIDYKPHKRGYIHEIEVSGSDKRTAKLFLELREVQAPNSNRQGLYDIVLRRAQSPNTSEQTYLYRWEHAKHYFDAPFLFHSTERGVSLETHYNLKSKKVSGHSLPVGPGGKSASVARFNYENNVSSILNGENQTTLFRYDSKKRITDIEKYQNGQLLYKESKVWDSSTGNLLQKQIGNLTWTYLYDDRPNRHNPIQETISDGEESYTKYRTFSEDGFNLLLSETDGTAKKMQYTYVPSTNLLASEIIFDNETPKRRAFHYYDDCAVLIKTIVDDGATLDPDNLKGVTYRKITAIQPRKEFPCFGFKEIVDEKTIDATGNEILLKRVHYTYHSSGQIEREDHYDSTNTLRFSIVNKYNDQEQLTSTTDQEGNTTHYSYDNRFNLVTVAGPRPDQYKEIIYDVANRPIEEKVRQSDGSFLSTKKQYNTLNQVIASIDETGFITRFKYNVLGQVIEIIHPDGGIEQKEYDHFGNVLKEKDQNGNQTVKKYNIHHEPTYIHHPDGTEEHFIYNPNGTLAEHIGKNGCKTLYTYDVLDNPIKEEVFSSLGELLYTKTATYAGFNKLSETDEEGITTFYSYDFAGRKTSERKGDFEILYFFDELGRQNRTQKGDTIYVNGYDFLGRVIEHRTEDKRGNIFFQEKYAYDADGNKTLTITCNGINQVSYNANKQPIQVKSPDGYLTQFDYSYAGAFVKTTTDPDGIKKIETYDPLRRLSSFQIQNKKGECIQYREFIYDLVGNRTQAIEHVYEGTTPTLECVNKWIYGIGNRLERLIESDLKETDYLYDALGRLAVIVKPDGTEIHHEYDVLGRLKSLKSKNIHYLYDYDKKGRVVSVFDVVNKLTNERCYDAHDNLVEERLSNGYVLKYKYDGERKLLKLTLPDNTSATFSYIGGALYQVTYKGHATTYQRNLSGKPTLVSLPSKLGDIQLSYDECLRLKSSISPFFSAVDYSYDPTGHLIRYTFADAIGTVTSEYLYDDLHQLTSENGHTYAYDSLNNRIYKDERRHTINTLSQVINDGELDFSYDLNGNLIQAGDVRFDYDALGRLTRVSTDGSQYEYVYDSFNRRISKKTPDETIHYLWQGQNEIGSSAGELRILGSGLGAEIGAATLLQLNNELYIPIHDQRGALVALVDRNGKHAETLRYSAYGEESVATKLSPWRFCSKRQDPETGYLYFGRRYYSPTLGRWTSPDPRGFEDGPNLYAYVHNTPLLTIDLYGELAYLDRFRYYGWRLGNAAFDFAFPCGKALYNLPTDAPMWKRGALAFGAVGEAALFFVPPAKAGVSLAEKTVFQIGKSALARQSEKQFIRSAEKTTGIALENRVVKRAAQSTAQTKRGSVAYEGVQLNLDSLSKAGQVPDRGGLTRAGRALDKHGGRPGSVFPKATGSNMSKSDQGQFHLDDILTDPLGVVLRDFERGGIKIYSGDGRGVYFRNDGTLRGFIERQLE